MPRITYEGKKMRNRRTRYPHRRGFQYFQETLATPPHLREFMKSVDHQHPAQQKAREWDDAARACEDFREIYYTHKAALENAIEKGYPSVEIEQIYKPNVKLFHEARIQSLKARRESYRAMKRLAQI